MSKLTELKKITGLTEIYGLFSGCRIYFDIKFNKKGVINLPSVKYPIFFRPGTVDAYTLYEIFSYRDYDIVLPFQPKYIVDAGANIGLTSVFFANKFPEAEIISIEPEETNFAYLQKNTRQYPQIQIIKGALWKNDKFIEVKDNGHGLRGFMIEESHEETNMSFRGTPVKDIFASNTIIDILKIDIEGSEKYIFEGDYEEWLPNVRCLVIELHDRIMKGCSKVFFNTVSKYNFSCSLKGDNLFFLNEDLPAQIPIPEKRLVPDTTGLHYQNM